MPCRAFLWLAGSTASAALLVSAVLASLLGHAVCLIQPGEETWPGAKA